MRHLAIDYGTKRVGLAISDEAGVFAFPYKTIQNSQNLVDDIINVCQNEQVGAIVMGESLDLSGLPNKLMGEIKNLQNDLILKTNLPVNLQKEFMTTVISREQPGVNKSVDSSAAALILQRYLDKLNNQK